MGIKRGMVGREEEEGDRQRGIPRAPSIQGDSSLRELGWVRSPNPFVHPPPSPSWSGGIGRLVYGVTIVGAGVANRFSAISLRLPPK